MIERPWRRLPAALLRQDAAATRLPEPDVFEQRQKLCYDQVLYVAVLLLL